VHARWGGRDCGRPISSVEVPASAHPRGGGAWSMARVPRLAIQQELGATIGIDRTTIVSLIDQLEERPSSQRQDGVARLASRATAQTSCSTTTTRVADPRALGVPPIDVALEPPSTRRVAAPRLRSRPSPTTDGWRRSPVIPPAPERGVTVRDVYVRADGADLAVLATALDEGLLSVDVSAG